MIITSGASRRWLLQLLALPGVSRFPNIDLPLEIPELNFRAAAVDRPVHRLVNLHPVLAAVAAPIVHHRLRRGRFKLYIKIADAIPLVRTNADSRLQTGARRHT